MRYLAIWTCVALASSVSCGTDQAYAVAGSTPLRPPPSPPERPVAAFLQPLSRDLERQLPDLGTSRTQREQSEDDDPTISTWWVWPKEAPEQESTQKSSGSKAGQG